MLDARALACIVQATALACEGRCGQGDCCERAQRLRKGLGGTLRATRVTHRPTGLLSTIPAADAGADSPGSRAPGFPARHVTLSKLPDRSMLADRSGMFHFQLSWTSRHCRETAPLSDSGKCTLAAFTAVLGAARPVAGLRLAPALTAPFWSETVCMLAMWGVKEVSMRLRIWS